MNCDVVGFIALDEILRFFFGGVVGIAFEFHSGNDFLRDSAANSPCFRAPFNVIAAFERPGRLSVPSERKMHPATQSLEERRCQPCLQHHEEYRALTSASGWARALPTARPW